MGLNAYKHMGTYTCMQWALGKIKEGLTAVFWGKHTHCLTESLNHDQETGLLPAAG